MSQLFGERDICPACGSEQVTHVVFGMATPSAVTSAPEWVRFAGCVITPDFRDRQCSSCGHEWNSSQAVSVD